MIDAARTIQSALSVIPADDRDTWIKVGMAVKSELGDEGFLIWDEWSQTSERYSSAAAQSAWRSFRGHGLTVASLIHEAKQHGWVPDAPLTNVMPSMTDAERHRRAEADRRRADLHDRRAADASRIVDNATINTHPYLARKQFPNFSWLIGNYFPGPLKAETTLPSMYPREPERLHQVLVVPMRHVVTDRVRSVQAITANGDKYFLPGSSTKSAILRIGSHASEQWWCEGFATALSIRAALAILHRKRAQVVVTFSAYTLAECANHGFVVADNDVPRGTSPCGAGERAAKGTGLPYWMPPDLGDANDFHCAHGLPALADALRDFLLEIRMHQ